MSGFQRHALKTLVAENGRGSKLASAKEVWNLNLDQIESDTGRVLAKQMVSTEKLGPSTYPFETGTVLYSKLRPYLNKVVVADASGVATTELVPLRCIPEKLLPQYLAYFLRSSEFLQFANIVVAGAKMPRMVMGEFWDYKIPLPPLPEQHRIAAILNQADALRAKRREALAQLDSLTQSIFIEMFGDLLLNTNGYPVGKLGDLCDVRDGTHDSPKFYSEGYPLVTTKNLRNGQIDFSEASLISEEDYLAINKRSKVDMGDILMPMIGTIGNPVLVEIAPEFAIKNMALIKFLDSSPDRQFVLHFLKSACFDKIVAKKNKGGTQKFLALGEIRSLPIPVPPKTAQDNFAAVMVEIRSHSEKLQVSLSGHNSLFTSLQDRAFRGEL